MHIFKHVRNGFRPAGVAAVVVLALAAVGCSNSSSTSSSASGAKVKGGTVTWAELPASPPNWIFPFVSAAYFDGADLNQFQYLMYRPLYFFDGPTVDYGLSLADAPVYSNGGKTVTINLKGWKWSNGETVDANDVIFWLHMMEAEGVNWAAAVPGGIPANITSMSATGPDQVTLQLNKAYSSLWYTYNELSQITPMPMAWDVTSAGAKAGSGGCTTDSAADKWAKCVAVYKFLTAQAKATSTYTTSPIWTVVNGPWKLQRFNTDGNVSFVPNPKYSGSPKPQISVFEEVPYTDDSSEYTAVRSGSVDIGYIPAADLPVKPVNAAVPTANPAGPNFKLAPLYDWGFAFYQVNFNNPVLGPVFKQLYVRQALEYVADQEGMSKTINRGYGYPTTGPAPAEPAGNQWLGSAQKANGGAGPYPFNIAKAASLLTSHGWKEIGGVMTCQTPTKCGAGIKAGQQLKFTLYYYTGTAAFTAEYEIYKSDASKAGIDVDIIGQSFNTVIGEAVSSNPSWQAATYGWWGYEPDYEPTGEEIFATGATSNAPSYSNPEMDSLIAATETSGSLSVYHTFASYSADQLPFIYMPMTYTIQAVNSKLHGVVFNPLDTPLPEYYYFTK